MNCCEAEARTYKRTYKGTGQGTWGALSINTPAPWNRHQTYRISYRGTFFHVCPFVMTLLYGIPRERLQKRGAYPEVFERRAMVHFRVW
jgi:hypothetical protein